MATITLDQKMRVAKYATNIGVQNGADYHTSDKEVAEMMAIALTEMTMAETPKRVNDWAESMIKAVEKQFPSADVWTYLCMYANWLSWAWHAEGNNELSEAWADAWYKQNDWSIENLKGKNRKYYIEKTD